MRWVKAAVFALFIVLVAQATASPAHASGPVDDWRWPLDPAPLVVRAFDPPVSPWAAGHRGIDLAAQVGQAVLAVAPGRVSFAGVVAGRGVVVVRHGRLRSTYEPVMPVVREGDIVAAGAVLGRVTSVGSHCVPAVCLHLGARIGDRYVDPLALLGDRPIRLKPIAGDGRALVDTASGPWVGLSIGGAQALRRDMGVDLRGGQ